MTVVSESCGITTCGRDYGFDSINDLLLVIWFCKTGRDGVKRFCVREPFLIASYKPLPSSIPDDLLARIESGNNLKSEKLVNRDVEGAGKQHKSEIAGSGFGRLVASQGVSIEPDPFAELGSVSIPTPNANCPDSAPQFCRRDSSLSNSFDVPAHSMPFSSPLSSSFHSNEDGSIFFDLELNSNEVSGILTLKVPRMERVKMTKRELNAKVGNTLRLLREHSGLHQTELASYLELSFQAVSKWERGINLPSYPVLVNLARLYGVKVDDFHTLTEEQIERLPKVEVEG